MQPRRVVTGESNGRSCVTHDGPTPMTVQRIPETAVHEIWWTDSTPALDGPDPLAGASFDVEAPPGGTKFRLVYAGPGIEMPRHRTDTIDYVTVISGEITLGLDEGDVVLRAGDCLVQRGIMHSWHNRGSEPCVLSVAMVSLRPASAPTCS